MKDGIFNFLFWVLGIVLPAVITYKILWMKVESRLPTLSLLATLFCATCGPITIPYYSPDENETPSSICLDSVCDLSLTLKVKQLLYPNSNYLHLTLLITNNSGRNVQLPINEIRLTSKQFIYQPHDIAISSNHLGNSKSNGRDWMGMSETTILAKQEVTLVLIQKNQSYNDHLRGLKEILTDEEIIINIPSFKHETITINQPLEKRLLPVLN